MGIQVLRLILFSRCGLHFEIYRCRCLGGQGKCCLYHMFLFLCLQGLKIEEAIRGREISSTNTATNPDLSCFKEIAWLSHEILLKKKEYVSYLSPNFNLSTGSLRPSKPSGKSHIHVGKESNQKGKANFEICDVMYHIKNNNSKHIARIP